MARGRRGSGLVISSRGLLFCFGCGTTASGTGGADGGPCTALCTRAVGGACVRPATLSICGVATLTFTASGRSGEGSGPGSATNTVEAAGRGTGGNGGSWVRRTPPAFRRLTAVGAGVPCVTRTSGGAGAQAIGRRRARAAACSGVGDEEIVPRLTRTSVRGRAARTASRGPFRFSVNPSRVDEGRDILLVNGWQDEVHGSGFLASPRSSRQVSDGGTSVAVLAVSSPNF